MAGAAIVVVAAWMPAMPACALGTLFYTPAEREAIVRNRLAAAGEAYSALPQQTRLDGLMRRPEGALAWFDGQPFREGDAHPFGRVRILPDAVRLGKATLRPGETLRADGEKLPAPKLENKGGRR